VFHSGIRRGGALPLRASGWPPGEMGEKKFCLGLCPRFHRRERSGDRPAVGEEEKEREEGGGVVVTGWKEEKLVKKKVVKKFYIDIWCPWEKFFHPPLPRSHPPPGVTTLNETLWPN
jgi:hypothetical protein